MPSWVLLCNNCKNVMLGADVSHPRLANFIGEAKLQFPVGGWEVECPHCGKKDTYHTDDQRYSQK